MLENLKQVIDRDDKEEFEKKFKSYGLKLLEKSPEFQASKELLNDPSYSQNFTLSPIFYMAYVGSVSCLSFFLECYRSEKLPFGNLLHWAIHGHRQKCYHEGKDNFEIIKLLLNHGENLLFNCSDGFYRNSQQAIYLLDLEDKENQIKAYTSDAFNGLGHFNIYDERSKAHQDALRRVRDSFKKHLVEDNLEGYNDLAKFNLLEVINYYKKNSESSLLFKERLNARERELIKNKLGQDCVEKAAIFFLDNPELLKQKAPSYFESIKNLVKSNIIEPNHAKEALQIIGDQDKTFKDQAEKALFDIENLKDTSQDINSDLLGISVGSNLDDFISEYNFFANTPHNINNLIFPTDILNISGGSNSADLISKSDPFSDT
jgi:hypothetical protein